MTNAPLYQALNTLLNQRFTQNVNVLEHHSKDESWHSSCAPQGVCYPHNTEEVSEIIKLCAQYQTPITAFGAGTSVEGQSIPSANSLCIDLSEMDQIVDINIQDLNCRVQAGVTRQQLNDSAQRQGLFFPIDPGANATIGGMCATRASGTNAVRYGTMKDNVLSLKAVMANGDIIETGTQARKSAAGLDLTSLLIGSEGTLAIITEITLKLHGIPDTIAAAQLPFSELGDATEFVTQVLQSGIPIARIELLDDVQINAVNAYNQMDLPETPTLFLEFHGSEAAVREQVDSVQAIAATLTPYPFAWSTLQEERNQLWKARHQALYAAKQLVANARVWTTDVCVPISKLSECLLATKKDLDEAGLLAPIVGHVGDGNFHTLMVLPEGDHAAEASAKAVNQKMIERAVAMGGTCTGEHGIGIGKKAALQFQHADTLPLMKQIKQALDPNDLLNPGKLYV
ncbi:MAG: FAD-binding protein [Pseudomonadales bacterium]|nr:FAD-binding protein [Pseudomonadales bacterium]